MKNTLQHKSTGFLINVENITVTSKNALKFYEITGRSQSDVDKGIDFLVTINVDELTLMNDFILKMIS